MQSTVKSPKERTRVLSISPEDTKTKAVQSEARNSDINNIVAKAYKTGQLPVLMNRKPMEQLPGVETYQDAMNKVVFAQQAFARLPSEIRNSFDNDPAKMLFALENSKDNPELTKKLQTIGLLDTPAPPEAAPSAPTTQAQETPTSGNAA